MGLSSHCFEKLYKFRYFYEIVLLLNFSGKLFHRVILMSGSALSPWAVVRDTSATTTHVAEALNCSLDGRFTTGGRHQTLLQCLRSGNQLGIIDGHVTCNIGLELGWKAIPFC